MHDGVVLRILRCYIQQEMLTFTELCKKAEYPTDLGKYYIRRLVNKGYLAKTARGQYTITPSGKQQLNRLLHLKGHPTLTHPRLGVMVVVRQNERLLVNHRTRQPFIDRMEWPALMVEPGEEMASALQRLLNRLSIEAEPQLLGFFRRIDIYNDTVFDDKLFAVHSCELDANATVTTQSVYIDGLFLTPDELKAVAHPAKSLHDVYAFVKQPTYYQERRYTLSSQDTSAAL